MAITIHGEEAGIYAAADEWVDSALGTDGSLLTSGRIWSLRTINDFLDRISGHPDDPDGGFWDKFKQQLTGAEDDTIQLAAEILCVYYLIDGSMSGSAKLDRIHRILRWSNLNIQIPLLLNRALYGGICNPGPGFNIHKRVRLIAEFARHIKQQSEERRISIINDPWVFHRELLTIADGVPGSNSQAAALLHIVHPDKFERIVLEEHKQRIVRVFANSPSNNLDRDLLAIRERLSEFHGPDFDFYATAELSGAWNPDPQPIPPTPPDISGIAERLFWSARHLEEIKRLLDDKRQVVFYGPPGTGKTYVAQELAKYFAGEHGTLDLVQFHPSYAYEDFIEGFRPALVDDQPGFELKDGPLKRIADRARSEPNAKHVLVIDEINRGNLAKVFGELYFLLEYRDRKISLQYADQPFTLPENLWIIATMNTADRSIALVDAALRRRFYFVPFFPDEPPVEGLLRRWLLDEKPTMLWLADVVDAANQILKDLDKRDMAVGPSYFMNKKLDEDWVRRIWKHSILPYVEEQLFGQTDRIEEFELNKLRAAVQRSAGAEEEAATANGQADAAPEPGDA